MYDGEAALTAYPVTILGLDATVDQRSCSIGLYAALMQMLRVGYVLWREKLPARPFNNVFWSIAKDVYDGVGSIEYAGLGREVCARQVQARPQDEVTYRE